MTRRNVAVALMAAGLSALTAGAHLVAGPGVAALALGVCLVALAILIGWGA